MRFLVEQRSVLGFGSEAIGTDAGQGYHLRPPYPCHYYMHGAGRYGLQCLANLDQLPPTGAVLLCLMAAMQGASAQDKLKFAIINGEKSVGEGAHKQSLEQLLDVALGQYTPLDIINTVLLDGMRTVGDLFGSGQMQLPFVLAQLVEQRGIEAWFSLDAVLQQRADGVRPLRPDDLCDRR